MKLPDPIRKALEACPLPWRIELGTRHQLVYINDRMVAVLARNATKDSHAGRGSRNVVAQIKRAIREATKQ